MATPYSDPSSSPDSRKSWQQLARRAACAPAPEDLDVRAFVRAVLASTPCGESVISAGDASLWDDLGTLSGLKGLRFALLGVAVLSLGLLVTGTLALREVQSISFLTSPF